MFEGPKNTPEQGTPRTPSSKITRLAKVATLVGGLATGYIAGGKIQEQFKSEPKSESTNNLNESHKKVETRRGFYEFTYDSAGNIIDSRHFKLTITPMVASIHMLTDGDLDDLKKKLPEDIASVPLFANQAGRFIEAMRGYEDLLLVPGRGKEAEYILARLKVQLANLERGFPGIIDQAKLPDYLK